LKLHIVNSTNKAANKVLKWKQHFYTQVFNFSMVPEVKKVHNFVELMGNTIRIAQNLNFNFCLMIPYAAFP